MGESQKVRAALDHPVIDVDGHVIEFMPAIMPYLREALGPKLFDRYVNQPSPIAKILGADTATRLASSARRSRRGGAPRRRTPATSPPAAIPGLMYERLRRAGHRLLGAVPDQGLRRRRDRRRRAAPGRVPRASTTYYADTYAPVRATG